MAEVTGKVVAHLEERRGETSAGPWVRGGILVMPLEYYKTPLAFMAMGEQKVALLNSLRAGDMVVVTYRPQCREFEGNYYTDLMVVSIMVAKSPSK